MTKVLYKYGPLIKALEDDELYHVSKIIRRAVDDGFFDNEDDPKAARKRARSALANHALKLGDPDGEVEVTKPYRAFYPAWFGRTWKTLL